MFAFALILFGVLFSNIDADLKFVDYPVGDTFLIREPPIAKAHGSVQVNLTHALRKTLGLQDDDLQKCIHNNFNNTMPPIDFVLYTESESIDRLNGTNIFGQYSRTNCYANIVTDASISTFSQAGYYPHIYFNFQCDNTGNGASSLRCEHKKEIVEKFTAASSHELETGVETKLDITFPYTDRLTNRDALNVTHSYKFSFGKGSTKSNTSKVISAVVDAPLNDKLDVTVSKYASDLNFNVPYKHSYGGNILIKFQELYNGDYYFFLPCETLLRCAKQTDFQASIKIRDILSPDVSSNFTGHVIN